MTVGDIRKVIEGLPDEASVVLHVFSDDSSDGEIFAMLTGFGRHEDKLAIQIIVEGQVDAEDILDDEDDE